MRFLAYARNDSTRLSKKGKYGGEAAILTQAQRRLVVISNGVRNLNNCSLFLDLGILRISILILTLYFTQTSTAQHQTALRSHVNRLSSPLLQGRFTGSIGQKLAALYIQNQFDSVFVDNFEVIHIQHGGILVNAADTLMHRRDFFYSGMHYPLVGMINLDTFEVIQCKAADLYTLKTQYENKNTLFLLRDWDDFLDLFGHDFLEEEILLAKDVQEEPLHLFIKESNFSPTQPLEALLITNYKNHFTENLIIPLYSNTNNTETWIFSAHYDHLGSVDSTFFPGADDNASGVAVLIELAKWVQNSGFHFPVNLTFAFFSAEEQGLLGSRYYVQHSPHFDKTISACFNFDMVGFVNDNNLQFIHYQDAVFFTLENSPEIEMESIAEGAFLHEFSSDHQSFVAKNIPAFLFFTGLHPYYHTPEDTPEKLNYDAMNGFVLWLEDFLSGE